MRLPVPCADCCRANGIRTGNIPKEFIFEVAIEGPNRFEIKCPNGHKSLLFLKQPAFKILFESGCLAFVDGYYREAVGTFTAALERFFEYWVKAKLVERNVSEDDLKKTWNIVSRQSERQYGAFLFIYLAETNSCPPDLEKLEKYKNFRNDVIHKGKFPSNDETRQYAEDILRFIARLNNELQTQAASAIKWLEDQQASEVRDIPNSAKIPTIVGRVTNSWPKEFSFDEELKLLDSRRTGNGLAELSA